MPRRCCQRLDPATPTRTVTAASGNRKDRTMTAHNGSGEKRLRSRRWFDEPAGLMAKATS